MGKNKKSEMVREERLEKEKERGVPDPALYERGIGRK